MGCQLQILGLCVIITCDKCSAFGLNNPKPDLLILRKTCNGYEWLVVEIKNVLNAGAIRQVQAGINTIANSCSVRRGC